MKRKRIISRLKREIKRLRKKNEKLHDKYWSEYMQIAHYDNENRILRKALSMAFEKTAESMVVLVVCDHHEEDCPEHPESVSEQPERTYIQDYLERFPDISINPITNAPYTCRAIAYDDNTLSCGLKTCGECWNEVMPEDDKS